VPDLIISKSHTGAFRQGDAADIYTLTVANIGTATTNSMVTVTDILPDPLTPTAVNNGLINGWTVTTIGQTVTATRNDTLAVGSSYPALTIAVRVANSAPAALINTATVSGGGETKTSNDSVSDPTTIIQVADLTIAK